MLRSMDQGLLVRDRGLAGRVIVHDLCPPLLLRRVNLGTTEYVANLSPLIDE